MMLRYFLSIALACVFSFSFGQKTIYGKVVSDKSGEPLPYVNIGIEGTGIGSLSNRDGSYAITIPPTFFSSQLIFSFIGFERYTVLVEKVNNEEDVEIRLVEAPRKLQPVVVENNKLKHYKKTIGNSYDESSMVVTDSLKAGSEFALKFDIDDEDAPFFIHEINFKISHNSMKTLKARPHLYAVNEKTKLPGKELLTLNQIITSNRQSGWIQFQFEEAVVVQSDFFVSIEWIFDQQDRDEIYEEYHEFRKTNPEQILKRTAVIDGKEIEYEDFGGNLLVGWSLSCTSNPLVLRNKIAFIRYNSFGSWEAATAIPSIKSTITTRP